DLREYLVILFQIFTDNQRIAFARQGKGFFALNGNSNAWSKFFQTTMPAGDYCDHYAGSLVNGKCTGQTITVRDDGTAYLQISGREVVAFSLASRIGGVPPPVPVPSGYQKTVIFIKMDTYMGQNLFIRGGVSHANKDVCSIGPYQQTSDACAIPIIHNTSVPFVYAEYLSWSQGDQYLDFEGAEERQGTHDGDIPFGTPLAYSTNDSSAVEYQPYNKYGSGYWMVQLLTDCKKSDQGWFELKGYVSPSIGWEQDINQKSCSGTHDGDKPFGTPLAYSTNDSSAVEFQPYNKYGSGYWTVQLLTDRKKGDQGWFELKGYVSPSIGWEQDIIQKSCTGTVGGTAPFTSKNHIAKCGAVNVFAWGSGTHDGDVHFATTLAYLTNDSSAEGHRLCNKY
ncbi:hypothetical protein GCK32_009331, partial [Trichostrongylus colubriformis]